MSCCNTCGQPCDLSPVSLLMILLFQYPCEICGGLVSHVLGTNRARNMPVSMGNTLFLGSLAKSTIGASQIWITGSGSRLVLPFPLVVISCGDVTRCSDFSLALITDLQISCLSLLIALWETQSLHPLFNICQQISSSQA